MQTEIDRWLAEGQELVEHKDYALALIPLNHVVRHAPIGPESSKAWRLKSQSLVALGHLDQALTAADYAVRDRPESVEALQQRAQVYDLLKRYSEAAADYERALRHDPDNAWLWQRLGDARLDSGNDTEALHAFERASVIKKESPAAWYGQGLALERLERRDDALAAYEHALRIMPKGAAGHARILNSAALLLYRMRRLPDALAMLEQVQQLENAPKGDEAQAAKLSADILKEQQRYGESLAQIEQALALEPEATVLWRAKGWLLHRLSRFDDALAAYDESLRLDPTDAEACKERLYTLAYLLLTQAPPLDPESPAFAEIADREIWMRMIPWFAGHRRYLEAEIAVNQMLRLDPGDRFAYLFKVMIQLRAKQFQAAAATLRQAWQAPKRSQQNRERR